MDPRKINNKSKIKILKLDLEYFLANKNIEYIHHYTMTYRRVYSTIYRIYHNNGYRVTIDYINTYISITVEEFIPYTAKGMNLNFKEYEGMCKYNNSLYHPVKFEIVAKFELLKDFLWYIESSWLNNHIKGSD